MSDRSDGEVAQDESEVDHRYAYSQLTDTWYRVDDWDVHNADKGQIVAKLKTEVPREDVPQHWIDAVEERDMANNREVAQ